MLTIIIDWARIATTWVRTKKLVPVDRVSPARTYMATDPLPRGSRGQSNRGIPSSLRDVTTECVDPALLHPRSRHKGESPPRSFYLVLACCLSLGCPSTC